MAIKKSELYFSPWEIWVSIHQFESINADAVEIIKLITTIIKSKKSNINH